MRSGTLKALALVLPLLAAEAAGRDLPIAPVTRWPVIPVVQRRAARHVVVRELESYGASCWGCVPTLARLVVHDSLGVEAPRDVTPGGKAGGISPAAAWEGADGTLRLLVTRYGDASGTSGVLYSPDGGATWIPVALPAGSQAWAPEPVSTDIGGPVAYAAGSPIRLGTPEVPFVVSVSSAGAGGIWAIRADGSAYSLTPPTLAGDLLGSDLAGGRFLALLHPAPPANAAQSPRTLSVLDLSGNMVKIFDTTGFPWMPWMEGWITPSGSAYLNVDWTWDGNFGSPSKPAVLPSTRSVALWKDGSIQEVVASETGRLLGAPSTDYSGAWIARSWDGPTVLASHTASGGLVEAWRDATWSRITGICAAESGKRLLLLRSFLSRVEPGSFALAVWDVGQPSPPSWDRVIVNALGPPTLVHLDVDAAATAGAPVFVDPGAPQNMASPSGERPPPTSPAFFQMAPLMRFSLRQQLVIPAAARVPGLLGAEWRSDLVLRNPGARPLPVTLRFLPNPATSTSAPDASVTVGPASIVVIPDVLASLFGLEKASGALLLDAAAGDELEATGRVYTVSPAGTYGMTVDAEDVVAASRQGFTQRFPAALLGSGFRTNFLSCDVSGDGARVEALGSAGAAPAGKSLSVEVPPAGQRQLDDVAGLTGIPGSAVGSFRVTSRSGATLSGFTVIDNSTNDPLWCGPEVLPGSLDFPAVVHSAGAHGAEYRTDLFLFNPDAEPRTVLLWAVGWDEPHVQRRATVTLAPGESRRVPDVLSTLFGMKGVARLRLETGFPNGGVSTTSRTYTLRPDGATYGMLVPPLGASQVADPGEVLEILGPTGGAASRTNLSLVSLTSVPGRVKVQVFDDAGALRDEFDQEVPGFGGVQVNDLFRVRGLGDGPRAAILRLSLAPPGGPWGSPARLAAYATTIDDGTNDPIYFAGRLAAGK